VQCIRQCPRLYGFHCSADNAAFIAVNWPTAATIATPANCQAVAAAITRLIAESANSLARWKVHADEPRCTPAGGNAAEALAEAPAAYTPQKLATCLKWVQDY
jgi:hypothetical protein